MLMSFMRPSKYNFLDINCPLVLGMQYLYKGFIEKRDHAAQKDTVNECMSDVFLLPWFLWLFSFRMPIKEQHRTLQIVFHPRQIGNHLP